MRDVSLLAVVAVAACWHGTTDGPEVGAAVAPVPSRASSSSHGRAPVGPLALEVIVSTPNATMATREQVEVGVRATNLTQAPFDPGLHACELLVDGEPSVDFRAAVSNGTFDPEWTWLPAGRAVALTRPLGDLLFDHPGDYTLVVRLGALQSTPVHVRVDP